ncbi:MAG: hypothetical protein IPH16_09675 [Haliscomenobacter sp.]|nr:hypothetical protein [Haliscomenobacter sp.]
MALVEAKSSRSLDTLGSGVYRSEDAGKTWRYVNTYNNRPFYYSQIRINPQNDRRVYLLTTPFMVSEDGGKSFRNGSVDEEVHGDFHAMWLDPAYGDRYYLGADKGASLTHDHGNHFFLFDNLPIGQFYRIGADMRDPYVVYGGLQDNGFFATASFTRDARGILNDANWKVHWGDGQYAIADPTDWRTVYTSMENGSIFRYDPVSRELIRITPMPLTIANYPEAVPASERRNGEEFRYNWSAPMVMSPHDPKTLFMGRQLPVQIDGPGQNMADHLSRSIDQPPGETPKRLQRGRYPGQYRSGDPLHHFYHCAISCQPASDLGGHGRRERAAYPRRGGNLDQRSKQYSGRTRQYLGEPDRCFPF